MNKCFHIGTTWGGHYTVGVDDGEGFTPKKIKHKRGYYEVIGDTFSVRVYGVAYAKFGDPEKSKVEPKAHLKVVEK